MQTPRVCHGLEDETGGGDIRSQGPRSAGKDLAVQTLMCVRATCKASPRLGSPWAFKALFRGYSDLQGGFEGLLVIVTRVR